MLTVYVNYPNPHLTIHHDPNCNSIQAMQKQGQRKRKIDGESISSELQAFRKGEYRFASKQAINDMWIEVDFQDEEFETAVVAYVHRLLAQRYRPFSNALVKVHC